MKRALLLIGKCLLAIALVVGIVAAAAVLGGCSTFTKQVYTPISNPESEERCVIVYDHVIWNMGKQGTCRGEARI